MQSNEYKSKQKDKLLKSFFMCDLVEVFSFDLKICKLL